MTPQLPITIRRSYYGVAVLFLMWVAINALLYWGIDASGVDGQTQELIAGLAMFVTAITGLFVLVGIYLYLASRMTFTEGGVEVVRYKSLIHADISLVEWENVELIRVQSGGILRLVFGIGTVYIQTAATDHLSLNWVGNIERVQEIAAGLAAVND